MSAKINHPILRALADVTRELRELTRDERCDHSVGICMCDSFRALDAATTILRKNGLED